jgi:hypothetical protein
MRHPGIAAILLRLYKSLLACASRLGGFGASPVDGTAAPSVAGFYTAVFIAVSF